MASEITPMIIPTRSICDDFMSPVEYAMALGGVLMGSDIAKDAERATPMSSVPIPPYSPRAGPIPLPTAASMGIISAVAAEFEINVDNVQQITPPPIITSSVGQLLKGIAFTNVPARPVLFITVPRAKPPATIHRQAQSISFKSFDFIMRVIENTPMGISATTYEFMPTTFSNIHKRMVTTSVA